MRALACLLVLGVAGAIVSAPAPSTKGKRTEPDAATGAVTRDESARASKLLERLPPKQRMAVTLRVNQDLSYAEIGEILDCSEGAARVNYHLGIKRLRELVHDDADV